MIKVFKTTDTDFSSNGDKIIKSFDATIVKSTDEEYLELEAPLEYAEFLIQDNILIVDTLTGKKGYRIYNPTVGSTVRVKAPLHYQENQPDPKDREVVISYGKNLENCEVSENWDNVVTKITPTGYNGAVLPEGYLSVVSPHQRVYEKTIEFGLSTSIEAMVETLEATIEDDTTSVNNLTNSKADLQGKITACNNAVTNLQTRITEIQTKINSLGTSEAELKEKAVLQAEITELNNEISALNNDKTTYQATLTQTETDLVAAQSKLTTDQATYNNLIVSDLRTQAQSYLDANIYPQTSYNLQAHLNGITEVGDTVKVYHERMKIDMLAYVTAYKYDCITEKFTDIQFGTQPVSLRSKISGMEKNIKSVSDGVKNASSLIEQLSNSIVLRVDDTGKMALFKLASEGNGTIAILKADNINLEGLVTANEYFKILADGSIEAVNGTFKGKIIASSFVGGSIESDNYKPNVSGTKLYLIDGAIDTKYFKLDSQGKVTMTGGTINIVTSTEDQSVIQFAYNTRIMRLSPSHLLFSDTETNDGIFIDNTASGLSITFTDNGSPTIEIDKNGIETHGKPITCGALSAASITEGGTALSEKYAPYSHSHSGYASDSGLTALEQRVADLEALHN